MTTQNKTNKKKGINKKIVILINVFIFVITCSFLIWAIKAYFHIGSNNYTNDAQVEEFINPINSKVQGFIKEIRFIEHQQIRKGDTLVILDDRELKIQVSQAEAALMSAIAAKELTYSSIKTAQNNVNVSESNIAAAKARLNNMEQNYNRYSNLIKTEVVTKAQFDQIKSEYDASKSQYEALLSQCKTVQLTVAEATKKLDINEADIKRAQANLDMAKLSFSYSKIIAPYSCIVGRRLIQEGQLIQPGQQLLTIVKSNDKWIAANFREKQMNNIKVGEKVVIEVDALEGKKFEGIISAISGASGSKFSSVPVDNSTGNFVKVQQRFPVRIELTPNNTPENIDLLRAGMNVEVTIKK